MGKNTGKFLMIPLFFCLMCFGFSETFSDGFLNVEKTISHSDFVISKDIAEQKAIISNSKTSFSITPEFNGATWKQDTTFNLSFEQKKIDYYKYSFGFNTKEYTAFNLVFSTEPDMAIVDAPNMIAYSGSVKFDFTDIKKDDYDVRLVSVSASKFALVFENLKPNTEYFFDPAIQSWYSSNYAYKDDFNVTNNSGIAIDTNHTVSLQLNTTNTSKYNDTNCIAITYQDTTETDANIIGFGTANSIINFKLLAPIAIGATDNKYNLYSKCTTIPIARRSMYFDNFDDNSLKDWNYFVTGTASGQVSISEPTTTQAMRLYNNFAADDTVLEVYSNKIYDLNKHTGLLIKYKLDTVNSGCTRYAQFGFSDDNTAVNAGHQTYFYQDINFNSGTIKQMSIRRKASSPNNIERSIDGNTWITVPITVSTNMAALHLLVKNNLTDCSAAKSIETNVYSISYIGNDTDGNASFMGLSFDENSPRMTNMTLNPSAIEPNQTITIRPNDISDADHNSLYFYCDENGQLPTATVSKCTETSSVAYPYTNLKCSYIATNGTSSHTVSCRAYDGEKYSETVTANYYLFQTYLQIKFVDEKTGVGVKPDTLTIDGNSWLPFVDSNGLFYIGNLTNIPVAIHTIVASKANYGTRSWDLNFGINHGSYPDYNFAMIQLSTGKNINFQFFAPDETTYLGNYYASVRNVNGLIAGIGKTTAEGKISFYVDSNHAEYYTIDLNDTVNYTYSSVAVTILVPKDERSKSNVPVYRLQLTGAGSGQDYNGLTSSMSFNAFGNTEDFYKMIFDDANTGTYLQTVLLEQFKGNQSNVSIQPYMVPVGYGITSVLTAQNPYTRKTIEGLIIFAVRDYNGGSAVVYSNSTDAAGTVSISWMYLQDYNLLFYYPNTDTLIWSARVTPNSSTYGIDIDIDLGGETGRIGNDVTTDINIASPTVVNNLQHLETSTTIIGVTSTTIVIKNGSTTVLQHTYSGSDTNFLSGHYEQNFGNIDFNVLTTITVTVSKGDKNIVSSKSFFVTQSGRTGLIDLIINIKSEFGDFWAMIIALIISTMVVAGLSMFSQGNQTTAIVGFLSMGFFVLVNWISIALFLTIVFCGFSTFILFKRDIE